VEGRVGGQDGLDLVVEHRTMIRDLVWFVKPN
jgi:hypothetical protein